MGGSSSMPEQPTPPPQPTAAESTAQWVESMPDVFAEQQRQNPLAAQQSLELMEQYGVPLAQAYRATENAANPQAASLQNQLSAQASEGMSADTPQWMQDEYLSNSAAQLGTNIGSPIAADYQSTGMMKQKMDYQNYYRDMGLSISGRQPVGKGATGQNVDYTAGYTPGSVMDFNSSTYAPYASAYSGMYGANANLMGQQAMAHGEMVGGAIAGGGAILGGMIGASARRFKKNIKLWE